MIPFKIKLIISLCTTVCCFPLVVFAEAVYGVSPSEVYVTVVKNQSTAAELQITRSETTQADSLEITTSGESVAVEGDHTLTFSSGDDSVTYPFTIYAPLVGEYLGHVVFTLPSSTAEAGTTKIIHQMDVKVHVKVVDTVEELNTPVSANAELLTKISIQDLSFSDDHLKLKLFNANTVNLNNIPLQLEVKQHGQLINTTHTSLVETLPPNTATNIDSVLVLPKSWITPAAITIQLGNQTIEKNYYPFGYKILVLGGICLVFIGLVALRKFLPKFKRQT